MNSRTESYPDLGRSTVATELTPGQQLRIVKYIGYGWSSQRSRPALIDQVVGALAAAHLTGWDGLLAEQRSYLDEFWDGADVEVDGDAEIQQAVRFGLFHILQAGARAEYRPIAAKGLTGSGYDGHTFWDTETFVLPVLTYTQPSAAADALRWRHLVLAEARQHAADLGLAGAAFPWRTIRGQECSGYWPAGTAAFHINADIADAVGRYLDATEDAKFETEVGLELLVETARLWRSLGQHDAHGPLPDRGRDRAGRVQRGQGQQRLHQPDGAAEPGLRRGRGRPAAGRRRGARCVDGGGGVLARRGERDVHPVRRAPGRAPAARGLHRHARWDFEHTPEEQYPLLLHFPYFDLYRKQVVKQADLVLAMHLRGDAFTAEQKARNFAYYEPLTVRDSSLSACTQAVMAAEVGHLELAHDYLGEAALMDLRDVEHNTSDGLHMASLAGAWMALVAGFGGMRAGRRAGLQPPAARRHVQADVPAAYRGRKLSVTISGSRVRYELIEGDPLPVTHHGEEFNL